MLYLLFCFADIKVTECRVISYRGDLLMVMVDKTLVVQLRVNTTRPWEVMYTISCPLRVVETSITEQMITIIDSDHSIRILILHQL